MWGFDDIDLCSKFALKFSEDNDIVNSQDWANKIPENGHNNNLEYHTKCTKAKISESISKMKWWNNGIVNSRSIERPDDTFVSGRLKFKRKSPSEESRRKNSLSHKGIIPVNKNKPMTQLQKDVLSNNRLNKVGAYCLITNQFKVVSKLEFDTSEHLVGTTSKFIPSRLQKDMYQ